MRKLKKRLFNRVAIIGLGLMGASLGLALKKGKIAKTVVGFARRPATRKMALKRKVVDIVCGRIEDAVKCADLVVICAPVGIITGLAKQCLPFVSNNAIVTDVGSSKACIVADMEKTFAGKQVKFVGSHPIAGSEQRGLEAARADLYRGAVVALTPTPRTSKKALRVVSKFWRAFGAQVVVISPQEHDRIIARTSHLPHIIAALLAACVGRERSGDYAKFCGTGFKDTTRVAEGDPELWRDILENNAHHLKIELSVFEKELKKILSGLKKDQHGVVGQCLKNGRDRRRNLLAARFVTSKKRLGMYSV